MPLALILSSYVAAARIGGGAQQFALAAFGVDPVLVPTVTFGKSPPHGGRGRMTEPDFFAHMLEDVRSEGLFGLADVVITGHFSHPQQVELAAEAIRQVRAAPRDGAFSARPLVVVDPILGDAGPGLYVKPDVAEAVIGELLPLADWLTPNLWELGHILGREITTTQDALAGAHALPCASLVTSVPAGESEIGMICNTQGGARLYAHRRLASAPNGTGDLVTALLAARLLHGQDPFDAAEGAARGVFDAVWCALEWNAPQLPIVAMGERLARPRAEVRTEVLHDA